MKDTKCRELTYQGYKFRIADIDNKYTMAVYLDTIGWIGFKNCRSKAEVWNILNNFTIDDLF